MDIETAYVVCLGPVALVGGRTCFLVFPAHVLKQPVNLLVPSVSDAVKAVV